MARFQPALVLTSAQPSITRQLRAVHGRTGTSATAQRDGRGRDGAALAARGDDEREERRAEERLRADERRDAEDERAQRRARVAAARRGRRARTRGA